MRPSPLACGGGTARPRVELYLILFLAAALLATSLPLYDALASTPEAVFLGEDVYVLSQASADAPVTQAFVSELRAQPWVEAASPEVYAFLSLAGRAVVVRGVEAAAFFRLEGLEVPPPVEEAFLLVGSRLAEDLGVGVGDVLLLPGSIHPRLAEARVDGLVPASGSVGDEIVMDLRRARVIAGMHPENILLVRVKTEDGQRLLDHLAATDAHVLVGDGGGSVRVEEGRVVDDRLGALLLTRPELAQDLGRSYVSAFARYAGNSLRVLVLGMELLTFTLFGLILASSLLRHLVENRRDVGLILALGGRFRALFVGYGLRVLGGGAAAGVLGVVAGMALGAALEAWGAFTFFGHVLPTQAGPGTAAWILLLYAGTLLAALLTGLAFLLRQRPRDLLYEPPGHVQEGGEPS